MGDYTSLSEKVVVVIVGWIILAVVLCILLLLLFTPLGHVDYAAGALAPKVSARVISFDLPLFPRPAKAGAEAAQKKREKKPKPEKPRRKKPKAPLITREMIPELLKLVVRTLSRFRRKLTVNRFLLHITVGGGDPYSAVMAYGPSTTPWPSVGHYNVRRTDVQTRMTFSAETYTVRGRNDRSQCGAHYRRGRSGWRGIPKDKTQSDRATKAAAKERKGRMKQMQTPKDDFLKQIIAKIKEMVDANTVVGDPVTTPDGNTSCFQGQGGASPEAAATS